MNVGIIQKYYDSVLLLVCVSMNRVYLFFFFKQKTAYEMRISDWSSDVCSSDLDDHADEEQGRGEGDHRADRGHHVPAREHVRIVGVAPRQIGRAACRERVCQYV